MEQRQHRSWLLDDLRWWGHRRRLLWKQEAAAVAVTLGTLLFWLFLVEEVLE